MGKKSRSGFGMNILDHIFESLKKKLKFFDADLGSFCPGSGMEKTRIRDKHPGSATLLLTTIFINAHSVKNLSYLADY